MIDGRQIRAARAMLGWSREDLLKASGISMSALLRMEGALADILRTHHFHSGEELEATILRYVWLYNHQLPQKALGHVSPIQAMKQWQRSHPELFNRRVTNQPGHDSYPSI